MILIWDDGQTMDIKFGYNVGGALKNGVHASNVIFGIEEIYTALNEVGALKFEEYVLSLRRQLSASRLRPLQTKQNKKG